MKTKPKRSEGAWGRGRGPSVMIHVVGAMLVVSGCAASAEDSTASLTAAVTGSSSSSGGENAGTGEGRGKHRGPPPEAFTACESKAAGDACTVTTPKGDELTGTCASPPADAEDTRLACRPDHMPEGGPPPRGAGGGRDCEGKPGQEPAESAEDPS